jgi:hypothetical protein
MIITLVFEKHANFFSQKIVIIRSTPGHSFRVHLCIYFMRSYSIPCKPPMHVGMSIVGLTLLFDNCAFLHSQSCLSLDLLLSRINYANLKTGCYLIVALCTVKNFS